MSRTRKHFHGIFVFLLLTLPANFALADPLIGNVGEKDFTDQPLQIKEADKPAYYRLYQDPDVNFLREVLTGFAKGKTRGISPVALEGATKNKTEGLRNFDRAYFLSPFAIIQVAPMIGGGYVLSIVFVNKPDRMFDCWVFKTESGYELRAFTEDTSYTAKEIGFVYRNVLNDPKARK